MAQPIAFQATIAVTGTAQVLPSNAILNGGVFSAGPNNTAAINIGNGSTDSASTGFPLAKGIQTPFILFQGNTNSFFIEGTSGDVISFLGV